MISELELTGGAEDGTGEVVGGGGPWAGWVWGVGGAVIASVVWSGGAGWWDGRHDGRPDLRGYAVGDGARDNPCGGGALEPVVRAAGATSTAVMSPNQVSHGEAVDRSRCAIDAYAPNALGELDHYEVSVAVDLHKTTDPRPEFEDGMQLDAADLSPVAAHRIAGLGDLAVLQVQGQQTQQLRVLDGGAVFVLTVTGFADSPFFEDTRSAPHGGPRKGASDPAGWESAMVSAMRDVMKGRQEPHR